MGLCVSLHGRDSALKLSKNVIPSPVKLNSDTVNPPPPFTVTGSKDESFFDSQPWLDSDCEDDFYSVNGDFTPSRGNTPVHHSFPVGTLQVNKPPAAIEGESEPSPPDKKKRLSELFKDSLRIEQPPVNEENAKDTPYLSGTNSGRSSGIIPNGEGKSFKSTQCCLPGLLSNRSFRERKKISTSPARSGG